MPLIDIDHFGRIDEAFGNLFGDRVLVAIGRLMVEAVPQPDLAARYADEASAVLLLGKAPGEAASLAERLLDRVERIRIRRKGYLEPIDRITVSISAA